VNRKRIIKRLNDMKNESLWNYCDGYFVCMIPYFQVKYWSIREVESNQLLLTTDSVSEAMDEMMNTSEGKINLFAQIL